MLYVEICKCLQQKRKIDIFDPAGEYGGDQYYSQGLIQKKYGGIGFLQDKDQTCQRHIKWQLGSREYCKPPKSIDFFRLKHSRTAIVKVKIW